MTFSESKMRQIGGMLSNARAAHTCNDDEITALKKEYHQAAQAAKAFRSQFPESSKDHSPAADATQDTHFTGRQK